MQLMKKIVEQNFYHLSSAEPYVGDVHIAPVTAFAS